MTWSRRGSSVLAIAVAALVAVSPASAGADGAADLETARMLLKEGNELREKGDHKAALAKYEAAHALVFTPITGLEVGRTHLALGELVEARESFLAVGRIPVKAKESTNATSARLEADRLASELESRIPVLTVVVSGTATGKTTSVLLDGKPLPASSIGGPRKLNPGKHSLVAHAEGALDQTAEVTLAEGEHKTVDLHLAPSLSAPPAPTDGAKPPVEAPTTPAPTDTGRSFSPLVWLGFGAAAAGVVVGGVTGAVTLSKASALKDDCPGGPCPPSHHDDLRSTRTMGTISTVSFVVAGAGAALGVVGLLTGGASRPAASGPAASLHLLLGVGVVGVAGTFR